MLAFGAWSSESSRQLNRVVPPFQWFNENWHHELQCVVRGTNIAMHLLMGHHHCFTRERRSRHGSCLLASTAGRLVVKNHVRRFVRWLKRIDTW